MDITLCGRDSFAKLINARPWSPNLRVNDRTSGSTDIGTVTITQSVLILPQILEIYKVKRVEGISHSLIILNFLGDTFKTFYFFYNVKHNLYSPNPSSSNFAGSFSSSSMSS